MTTDEPVYGMSREEWERYGLDPVEPFDPATDPMREEWAPTHAPVKCIEGITVTEVCRCEYCTNH